MFLYLYNEETLVVSSEPFNSEEYRELSRAEYDEIALKMGQPPYKSPEEQERESIVQEQAELLQMRAEAAEEDLVWINERLDQIADYWDSLEGTVAVYGTDN